MGGSLRIAVHVKPEVSRVLRGEASGAPEAAEVLEKARELKIVLEPVDPSPGPSPLAQQFFTEVPNPERARQVADALVQCAGVEGAYAKPPDEEPGG